MSKAKMMNWLKKAGKAIVKAEEEYWEVTGSAEKTIMKKCGSERMMDDVVEEKINITINKTKDVACNVRRTVKESTRIQTAVVKIQHSMAQAKEKATAMKHTIVEQSDAVVARVKHVTEKKSVPMCRPVSHIDGSHAPMSGVPVCDKTPAPMTVGARMSVFVQRGTSSVLMCICK